MIESGADVVICQHSHCIGAYENYENGHIVYGQGNLLFDYPTNNQMWKEELLVELIFEDDKFNIRFIPIIKKDFSINLAKGDDLDNIIIPFQERSAKLADKDFIKNEWIAFCETKKYLYIYTSLNFGYVLRKLDRALGYILSNSILRSKKFLKLYNFLFCEAHADVQKTIFDLSYRNNWK